MSTGSSLVDAQMDVYRFHRAFDIVTHHKPTMPNEKTRELRAQLLEEEVKEFREAADNRDYLGMVDAVADIIYVALGAALALGVDITPVWREVQRSNMTKVGGHKAPNGKWIKPKTYSPADIASQVIAQFEPGQTEIAYQPEEELET